MGEEEVRVASCVEAWIEISLRKGRSPSTAVASCVEAWIEITPSFRFQSDFCVASCVEAWIEIILQISEIVNVSSRFLRGSVD